MTPARRGASLERMTTGLNDGDRFGGRRAVVIGGSVAGLCAARVLSEHFDEVTVVERDALDDESAAPRKGVPQGRHLHALLARGEQMLEGFFPGLVAGLEEDGATHVDFGSEVAWHHFGGWKVPVESGVRMLCASRPLIEGHVRRRLFALPGARKLDAHEVVGLRASPGGRRVTGVAVRPHGSSAEPTELQADLVVEASGRGSKLPGWLEEIGCPRPEESTVKVRVGYASRIYRRPDPSPYAWKGLYVLGTPPESRRIGAIFPIEGGRWIAVLAGMLGEHAGSDPEAFLEFARGLPRDDVYRALRDAEPLTDIETYKFPAHLRRHYEKLERMPEGLAVSGDALASFNPIFGQGMTTACLDAAALGECLVAHRRERGRGVIEGLGRRYHAAAAKAAQIPWMMSTSEDFRYSEVEGRRPIYQGAMERFTGMVHRATLDDREVHRRFLRVMHMLSGVEELLDPGVLLRVLRHEATSRLAR